MSLINEALKKAQRQRSLDAAPLSSAPSGVAAAAVTTHERAATHRHRSNVPVWFGLGLLLLGAGVTVLIMRYGFAPAAPTAVATPAPAPASVPAAAPLPPAPEPVVTLPPIVPIAPPRPAPVATRPPAPLPADAQAASVAAAIPSPAPVEVVPVAAPAVEDHETRVKAFLASARLAGVRGQDAQARVLMNEKVYRLKDMVEPELGLRLSAVRAGLLVFTDGEGKTYEKPY